MTTFGISDSGFTLKRLYDVLQDMKTALTGITDPTTGESLTPNLLDENDPFILEINSFSDGVAACWEQLQLVYNQFDPLKATGAGLKGTIQLNGIRWKAGTPSTAPFLLTGTPNTSIPATQVSPSDGHVVFDIPAVIFGSGGTVTVIGTATENGPFVALSGTVTKILTPYSNWTSVINTSDATEGTNDESDIALRSRQKLSTETPGASGIDSLRGNLLNLDGVIFCEVYQNKTLTTDSKGIPGKTIGVVIVGGDDNQIADTIFSQLCLGGDSYGSSSLTRYDNQGIPSSISWTRPAPLTIYVAVTAHVVDVNLYPADGVTRIKEAIVTFAQSGASGLGIQTGFNQNGFQPGKTVYNSDLDLPILSVLGLKINMVYIGLTSTPTDTEVAVDWNKVASILSANIAVTVTT